MRRMSREFGHRRGHALGQALALGFGQTRWLLAAQVVLLVLVGVLPVSAAWLTKLVFDELVRGSNADAARAGWLALAAAALGAGTTITQHIIGYLVARRGHGIELLVQDRLYARMASFVGLRPFEDPVRLGQIRLAGEAASSAPQTIVTFVLEVFQALVVVGGFVGVLLAVWPPMVAVLFVGAVPAVLAQLALARRYAATTETNMELVRRRIFYQSLLTDARAAQEIRTYGLAGLFSRRLADSTSRAIARLVADERRGAITHSGLALVATGIGAIGTVVVVLGVAAGRTSVGDMVLFVAAVAGVQAAISGLAHNSGAVAGALRLFENYLAVMSAPDDQRSGHRAVTALRRAVEFRSVWFRYSQDGPWVLAGVDLTIPAGAAVGMVGLNGAGKTTLVKLLCRFYEPDRGEILWDGVDIREFDVAALRRRIGATFQDFMQYDLTAAENIGVGDLPRIGDRHAIEQAAGRVEVHDALAALPNGYDTLLSRIYLPGNDTDTDTDAGTTLSGGQWQRIALARALMRSNVDLMILDEPSAGLDAEAEYRIHRVLRAHRGGRTSLLISHRLSAIRDADVIVVLAAGRVVEKGDHDTLMLADGQYARLFATQADGYQDLRLRMGDRS